MLFRHQDPSNISKDCLPHWQTEDKIDNKDGSNELAGNGLMKYANREHYEKIHYKVLGYSQGIF